MSGLYQPSQDQLYHLGASAMKVKKILFLGLLALTVGLAIVAILTARQLQRAKAPTARVPSLAEGPVCSLAFAVAGSPTPTPSGSPTPTPTGSATPTPTATPTPSGSPTPTPTPTATPIGATLTPGPTQVPGLPEAGITWPTIGLLGAGGISVLLGILALIL